MVEGRKIDLSAAKTETEIQKAQDKFFLKVTPLWFDWIKWVIIIGVIQVVADKTQDISIHLILGLSYLFLMLYMVAFFYQIEFHGIPLIKSEGKRRIVSGILSGLLSMGVFYLLNHLANQLNQ
jgi:hypothetical protein